MNHSEVGLAHEYLPLANVTDEESHLLRASLMSDEVKLLPGQVFALTLLNVPTTWQVLWRTFHSVDPSLTMSCDQLLYVSTQNKLLLIEPWEEIPLKNSISILFIYLSITQPPLFSNVGTRYIEHIRFL